MNSMVKRVATAVSTGILFSCLGYLYIISTGSMPGYITTLTAAGLLFWYPVIGFIIGIAGPIERHPLFPSLKMKILRGAGIGFFGNLFLTCFTYDLIADFARMNFLPIEGISPFILAPAEGLLLGALIDYVATKVAGDGKQLLDYMNHIK